MSGLWAGLGGMAGVIGALVGLLALLARWGQRQRDTGAGLIPTRVELKTKIHWTSAPQRWEGEVAEAMATTREQLDHIEHALSMRLTMVLERFTRDALDLPPHDRAWARLASGEYRLTGVTT